MQKQINSIFYLTDSSSSKPGRPILIFDIREIKVLKPATYRVVIDGADYAFSREVYNTIEARWLELNNIEPGSLA